jgi:uncharacterized caspase-like protein
MKNLLSNTLLRLIYFVLIGALPLLGFAQKSRTAFKPVDMSSAIPKPDAPADLVIEELGFSDAGSEYSNNLIDAEEKSRIRFVIRNAGKGAAYQLRPVIQELSGIPGIAFSPLPVIKSLEPGASVEQVLNLTTDRKVREDSARFRIVVEEANGFYSDAGIVVVKTLPYRSPQLVIADHRITSAEGGKIQRSQILKLQVILQNRGQGDGRQVAVKLKLPENVYPAGEDSVFYARLLPNESKNINFEFFVNKVFRDDSIRMRLNITEMEGLYGLREEYAVPIDQVLSKENVLTVSGRQDSVAITGVSLNSDVDIQIPKQSTLYKHRYALVIGNEDYVSFQDGLSAEANVAFAQNDARMVKEYLVQTLGFPPAQVFLLTNATRGKMNQELSRLKQLIQLDSLAEVVLYYAGHGQPDPVSRETYLMPVDVSAANLSDAIKLDDIYKLLGESKAKHVSVWLDACFSGGGRGTEAGLLAARSVKVKPKSGNVYDNMVVLSASSGEQVSLPYPGQYHGLFTYYLLKKLQSTAGTCSLAELGDYIQAEVSRQSLLLHSRQQTPEVISREPEAVMMRYQLTTGK